MTSSPQTAKVSAKKRSAESTTAIAAIEASVTIEALAKAAAKALAKTATKALAKTATKALARAAGTIEALSTSALSTSALLSKSRIVVALMFPRRHLALHELFVNAQLLKFFFEIIHFYYLRL
ncbi:hypothetical protein [Laceyella putida]